MQAEYIRARSRGHGELLKLFHIQVVTCPTRDRAPRIVPSRADSEKQGQSWFGSNNSNQLKDVKNIHHLTIKASILLAMQFKPGFKSLKIYTKKIIFLFNYKGLKLELWWCQAAILHECLRNCSTRISVATTNERRNLDIMMGSPFKFAPSLGGSPLSCNLSLILPEDTVSQELITYSYLFHDCLQVKFICPISCPASCWRF